VGESKAEWFPGSSELHQRHKPVKIRHLARSRAEGQQDIASIDQILAHPDLAPINANFDPAKKARKYDVSWHEPFGLRGFAAVAIESRVFRIAPHAPMYDAEHSALQ